MGALVPPEDLPGTLVPEDDLPEEAAPQGKQIGLGDSITRGFERGLWSLPALATGGALSAENFEAGTKWAKDRLAGGDRPFSEFQKEEQEWSRAGEEQHPWPTGISRGVGQAPGEVLLAIATKGTSLTRPGGMLAEAASPLAKFLTFRKAGTDLASRAAANAVTQGVRQGGTGLATSVAPTLEGKVAEGIGSGLTAGGLGYLSPAPVTPLIRDELSGLARRAGKQAVKAHRATDTDLGNLQNKYGAGQPGDEAIAGLKVLDQTTPDGEPVLPVFGNQEKLAKNWDAVAAHSGRGKAAAVEAVDEARPDGAVDMGAVYSRAKGEALPPLQTKASRAVYGEGPEKEAGGVLEKFLEQYGLGKGKLSELEDYKSTTQRYVNETGSQKNPVRPRQAIDNDPALRFRRSVGGIAREEGERVAEDVLGPERAAQFRADKESYGLAEDFGRYAHNAYNKAEAKPGTPAMAHKWDIIRRAEEAVARTHAPRAHLYKGLDDVLSGPGVVAGSADLTAGSLGAAPLSVAARSPNPILDYLRSRGLIK